jgi:hypothetical protein
MFAQVGLPPVEIASIVMMVPGMTKRVSILDAVRI